MKISPQRDSFAPRSAAARCYLRPLVRIPDGGAHHLEARSAYQLIDTDKRPCREMPVKVRAVDIVERAIQSKVGAEHLDADEVCHLEPGGFHCALDGLHDEPGLGRQVVRHPGSLVD